MVACSEPAPTSGARSARLTCRPGVGEVSGFQEPAQADHRAHDADDRADAQHEGADHEHVVGARVERLQQVVLVLQELGDDPLQEVDEADREAGADRALHEPLGHEGRARRTRAGSTG